MTQPTIDGDRLNRTLQDLGKIGDSPLGIQRIAFSPEDIAGREYTISLMHKAGLETRIDPGGNIIGRKEGAAAGLPAIAMGSHTDTVPSGGKYDGALGVMGRDRVRTDAGRRRAISSAPRRGDRLHQ